MDLSLIHILPLAHMIPECISNLLLPAAVFIYLVCIDWRMALAMLCLLYTSWRGWFPEG